MLVRRRHPGACVAIFRIFGFAFVFPQLKKKKKESRTHTPHARALVPTLRITPPTQTHTELTKVGAARDAEMVRASVHLCWYTVCIAPTIGTYRQIMAL